MGRFLLLVCALALALAAPAAARYEWTPVESAGFGDPANRGVAALEALGGRLFAGTERAAGSGAAQLWTSDGAGPWRQVTDFRPALPPTTRAIVALGGTGPWFLGTTDPGGALLYRSADGTAWEQVSPRWRATAVEAVALHRGWRVPMVRLPAGAANVTVGSALAVFEGALHVATRNCFGAELYRSRDGARWRVHAASGIAGAQRPEVGDFAVGLGHLWMTERPGTARVWRADWGDLGFGLGFQWVNDDGFGHRTVRDGTPLVAILRRSIYWGGRDAVRGAQVRRLDQSTIDHFDTTGPGVDFAPGPLRMTRAGTIAVTVMCPAASPNGCHGQVRLRTLRAYRLNGRRARIVFDPYVYELDPGASETIRFRTLPAERALLRRLRRVAVRAHAVALGNEHDRFARYVLEAGA